MRGVGKRTQGRGRGWTKPCIRGVKVVVGGHKQKSANQRKKKGQLKKKRKGSQMPSGRKSIRPFANHHQN